METVKVHTSQHIDIDYPVAGLGERIVAALIDYGIFIVLFFLFIILSSVARGTGSKEIFGIILIIVFALTYVFYDLLCEIFMNGQSIGKKIMKIKVISLDGAQSTIGQYFMRWLFRLIDFALTANLAGLICLLISNKGQRIGDMAAGTTVIKTVPRAQFHHIAFHPPAAQEYTPVFDDAAHLTDRDIELIHEVLITYYKTFNHNLVYAMAGKIMKHLNVTLPKGMDELDFLRTIIADYNYISSKAD
ncbi:MAG: RDD family protein [Daejeonella sp.]